MSHFDRITSRGILLAMLPLFVQIVVFCLLLFLFSLAQTDVMQELHDTNAILQAYKTATTVAESAALSKSSADTVDWSTVYESQAQANDEIIRLHGRLDSGDSGRLSELAAAVSKLTVAAGSCRAALSAPAAANQGALLAAESKALSGVLNLFDQIIERESTLFSVHVASVANACEQIGDACIAIAVVCLGLSLLVWYLYDRLIRSPFRRIRRNCALLVAREPLLPLQSENNEIAELDRLLHLAANDVSEAGKREQALADYAADMVCTLDQTRNFVSVNPFARRMLGYDPDKIVGMHLPDLIAPEDVVRAQEWLTSVSSTTAAQTVELHMKKADGTLVEARWSSLWSDLEKSYFCVVHDVTEQKRIEDLKQDFVNMVTHDLRSPLTSLFGSLKLIVAGAKGPVVPAVETEINVAANNVGKLVIFVNDLLDFQKLRVGKMVLNIAPTELEEIIEAAVAFVQTVAESKQIELRLPVGRWSVRCDKPKLLQTVTNLVSNALKFTPEGGTVAIEVAEFPHAVQVSVIDSGPGVPEQFRERIFEAFEQAPSSSTINYQGTGLGLAICKLIVEAHGGSIGVTNRNEVRSGKSVESGGSTFWFRIPK